MKRQLLRIVPLLAGVALMVLTVQLGNWQQRRAAEKEALQARIDAMQQAPAQPLRADAAQVEEWQVVKLSGVWLKDATRLIDNRTHQGQAGYHVLTPLLLSDGSGAVLVNRGWIAAGDRRHLPGVPAPAGEQQLEGVIRLPELAPFMLAAESAAVEQVWQHIDLTRHAALVAPALLAGWVLQQRSPAADGLVRDWPQPAAGIDRHRGYAFQWYALAALAGCLSAWYAWRLITRRSDDDRSTRLARG
ncbi:MAG: SURF1 family protein [Azoarcus sp.]|jgi:cytochrome oxidase assembly protein ShyY1|nr:SURF1 family protein [Azoarcus sp.]MDD2873184.1 SURF1 family protein [Azoarcus sp.]MDX9836574.1 SURF1 family protein [Azoarcus sp.]